MKTRSKNDVKRNQTKQKRMNNVIKGKKKERKRDKQTRIQSLEEISFEYKEVRLSFQQYEQVLQRHLASLYREMKKMDSSSELNLKKGHC